MAPACSEDDPQPDLQATITALEAKLAVLEAQAAAPAPTPTPEVVYVPADAGGCVRHRGGDADPYANAHTNSASEVSRHRPCGGRGPGAGFGERRA